MRFRRRGRKDDKDASGRERETEPKGRRGRWGGGPWKAVQGAVTIAATALALRWLKRFLPGIVAVLLLLIVVPALTFAVLWQRAERRAETAERWTRHVLDSLTTTVEFPIVPPGLTRSDTLYWQWTAAVAKVQARGFQHWLQENARKQRSLLDESDLIELRREGLADPERQIPDSLEAHPEVIPHAPVMGGHMFFLPQSIVLLPGKQVRAQFEDGHISGSMLLEYQVLDRGRIQWRVLWSKLD